MKILDFLGTAIALALCIAFIPFFGEVAELNGLWFAIAVQTFLVACVTVNVLHEIKKRKHRRR